MNVISARAEPPAEPLPAGEPGRHGMHRRARRTILTDRAALRGFAWATLVVLAVGFLAREAMTYLPYAPESYGRFWPTRVWLALHLVGGSVALLVGPFQFLRRLRTARPRVHRWMGRLYLASIVIAAVGAFRLALDRHPVFGFGFSAALFVMALIWIITTAMAYAAIRRRAIQVHREWMVRSYILTFSFVSFRIIGLSSGVLGLMRVAPPAELVPVFVWSSWVLPILVAEVIFAARRMPAGYRAASPPRKEGS